MHAVNICLTHVHLGQVDVKKENGKLCPRGSSAHGKLRPRELRPRISTSHGKLRPRVLTLQILSDLEQPALLGSCCNNPVEVWILGTCLAQRLRDGVLVWPRVKADFLDNKTATEGGIVRNEGKELAWEPRAGQDVRPGGRPLRRVTSFVRLLLSGDQGGCGCQCRSSDWESEMVRGQGGAGGKAGAERTCLGGEGDREESGLAAGFQLGLPGWLGWTEQM